jgi:hypothetical protein
MFVLLSDETSPRQNTQGRGGGGNMSTMPDAAAIGAPMSNNNEGISTYTSH